MRILFIRHGEPDYANDCLTETGRQQAAAAAERLAGEGISEIYASPCGRATETAYCTAARLNLPVQTLDFMREISWGGPGIPHNGHPWTLGDMMLETGHDFSGEDWRKHPWFKENVATAQYGMIAARFDGFLDQLGYRHEGRRFLCTRANDSTIALFSHGGSGACALAHILNLAFPYVCSVMPYDFTSVIALVFPVRVGEYVFPRIDLFNDCAHIHRLGDGPRLQQASEQTETRY